MDSEQALRLRLEMVLRDRGPAAVARAAGIGLSTLSRVLHGKQQPSDALVKRIEAAIRQEEAVPHDD